MAKYQFVFWGRKWGSETITMYVKPGNTADEVARAAINAALRDFNSRWPGFKKSDIYRVRARHGV